MPAYCEIALPVPLDQTFTYAVREGQCPATGGAGHCAVPQREADRRGDRVECQGSGGSRGPVPGGGAGRRAAAERAVAGAGRVDGAVLPGSARRGAARHAAAHGRGAAHGLLPHHRPGAGCAGESAGGGVGGLPALKIPAPKTRTWGIRPETSRKTFARSIGHGTSRAHPVGRWASR